MKGERNLSFYVSRCAAVLAIIAVSASVRAQGVKPRSLDLAGNVGFNNLTGVDNKKHVEFGGSAGLNITSQAAVLFEYNYLPGGSEVVSGISANAHYELIGAALRYSFAASGRVVPFFVAGGGYDQVAATASAQGITASASVNGSYFSLGGGASVYLGENWGLRPEFRFDRQEYTASGTTSGQNDVRGMISAFYQFGGTGKKSN